MKPVVISIGGWDPCGGAGLAADIKTFEQMGMTGMGVCSSLTSQTDSQFHSLQWVDADWIRQQLMPLLASYDVRGIKFGIMPNLKVIINIIDEVRTHFPGVPVIWDPVLKASAGFEFHGNIANSLMDEVMQLVTLITPNVPEAKQLFGDEAENPDALQQLIRERQWGAILLKGGHAESHADDVLVTAHAVERITGQRFDSNAAKHGSGCVLSAAILSGLAKEKTLLEACQNGKTYVERFLLSSSVLLGYHTV